MNLLRCIGIVVLALLAGGNLLARDWHDTEGKLLLTGELKGVSGRGDTQMSLIQRDDGVLLSVFQRYLAENERPPLEHADELSPDWIPAQRKWDDPMFDRLVPEDMPEMPLTEAAAKWAQWCSKKVFIDARALKAIGLAADVPVSGATRGLPACEALDRLLEPKGLTWFEREGFCYITTPARAKAFWIIDVYVPFGYGDSARLANEIVRDVASQSWKAAGGEGRLLAMSDGALVVYQTADVQRQIRQRYFKRMAPTRRGGAIGGAPKMRSGANKLDTPPLMTFPEFLQWAKTQPQIVIELDDEAVRALEKKNAGLRVPAPVPPVEYRQDLPGVYASHYCEQFGLPWEFDGKGVRIMSPGAQPRMYTRYYSIDEMYPYVKSPSEAVIELCDGAQTIVAPRSWRRGGGEGEMAPDEFGAWLVVRQTADVHWKLSGFLGQLRGAAGEPRNEPSRTWKTKDGRVAGEAAVRRARVFPTIVQRPNGEYAEMRFATTDADRKYLEPHYGRWDQWGRLQSRALDSDYRADSLSSVMSWYRANSWPLYTDLRAINAAKDEAHADRETPLEPGCPPFTALDRAVYAKGIAWYLRLGVIFITSEEAAENAREAVVYRVLEEGKKGDLVAELQRSVAPGTWDKAHDAAVARYGGSILLVRHSPLVHRELRTKLWRKLVPIHRGPPRAFTLPTTRAERNLFAQATPGTAESMRRILVGYLDSEEPTGRLPGFQLDAANLPTSSLRGDKVWPDGPDGVRCGTNFLLALEQLDLAWIDEEEHILFTTRAVAEKNFYKRSYTLKGLTGEGCEVKELLAALPKVLAPKTWKSAGGAGTIAVSADGSELEVTQNSFTHWELVHLIERLRVALDFVDPTRTSEP